MYNNAKKQQPTVKKEPVKEILTGSEIVSKEVKAMETMIDGIIDANSQKQQDMKSTIQELKVKIKDLNQKIQEKTQSLLDSNIFSQSQLLEGFKQRGIKKLKEELEEYEMLLDIYQNKSHSSDFSESDSQKIRDAYNRLKQIRSREHENARQNRDRLKEKIKELEEELKAQQIEMNYLENSLEDRIILTAKEHLEPRSNASGIKFHFDNRAFIQSWLQGDAKVRAYIDGLFEKEELRRQEGNAPSQLIYRNMD